MFKVFKKRTGVVQYGKLAEDLFGGDIVECKHVPRTILEDRADHADHCDARDASGRSLRFVSPSAAVPPPAPDEGRCRYVGSYAASLVSSTYPRSSKSTGVRSGDPICDCVGAVLFRASSLCVIADGCGWGMSARAAAGTAVSGFLEQAERAVRSGAATTRQLARALLDGIAAAHNKIMESGSDRFTRGTTTLLGAAVVRSKGSHGRWNVVVASIGDCKAFLVRTRNGSAVSASEVSARCRIESASPTDSGGRIGPSEPDGSPDVRNLATFHAEADEGDLLVLVTDGVHDNLDPSALGIEPNAAAQVAGLKGPGEGVAWNAMDATARDDLKRAYSEREFCRILASASGGCSVRAVCEGLVEHCERTVASSREFMEANPDKRQPEDRVKYPGKMDHTSVICLRIGYHEDLTDSAGISSPIAERVQRDRTLKQRGGSSAMSTGLFTAHGTVGATVGAAVGAALAGPVQQGTGLFVVLGGVVLGLLLLIYLWG
eukprot:m51a1_g10471 hypothetical protein (490) ;mRNA; f:75543-77495